MLKKKKKGRPPSINVKVLPSDKLEIDERANRFAKGNLSAWIRHAAKHYEPKKGEKISMHLDDFL